jgi:hypothetical protein
MIVYGIKWKCVGPQQATDIEMALTSQTAQRAVQMANNRAVQSRMNDRM